MKPSLRVAALVAMFVATPLAACNRGVVSAGPRTPTDVPTSTAGPGPHGPSLDGGEALDLPTSTTAKMGLSLPTTVPAALHLPGFDASIDLATCTLKVSITNEAIGFGKDSAEIGTEGRLKLGLVADQLASAADVLVVGHTSTEGSVAYNQRLSERRARAVADVLAARVAGARFDVRGAGKSQPLVPVDTTEAQRSQNRRVVIEAHIEAEVCS